MKIEAGRWDWFAENQNRMMLGGLTGKPPTIGNLGQYQSWLATRPPPESIVGAQQIPGAVPVALDWVILDDEGQDTWGATDPSNAFGPSVYWGAAADTPVGAAVAGAAAEYLGALYVEWSVAGIRSWQVLDVTPRGTFVIGAADWVRLSYIGCEAQVGEGGADCFVWFDETDARVQAVLRPAEQAEKSVARVSHGQVAVPAGGLSSVIACWLGSRARRVCWSASLSIATSVFGVGVYNLLGMRIAGYAWSGPNNPGAGAVGRPPNEYQSLVLPAGSWSVQARVAGANPATFAMCAEIE